MQYAVYFLIAIGTTTVGSLTGMSGGVNWSAFAVQNAYPIQDGRVFGGRLSGRWPGWTEYP